MIKRLKLRDAKGRTLYKGDVLRDSDGKFYIVDDPYSEFVLEICDSPSYKRLDSLGYPKRWIGKGIDYEMAK